MRSSAVQRGPPYFCSMRRTETFPFRAVTATRRLSHLQVAARDLTVANLLAPLQKHEGVNVMAFGPDLAGKLLDRLERGPTEHMPLDAPPARLNCPDRSPRKKQPAGAGC